MKTYLLLEYTGLESRVVDVYATKDAAITRAVRMGNTRDVTASPQITYHVIKKSVQGLHGISFGVAGKQRFIGVDRRNK